MRQRGGGYTTSQAPSPNSLAVESHERYNCYETVRLMSPCPVESTSVCLTCALLIALPFYHAFNLTLFCCFP